MAEGRESCHRDTQEGLHQGALSSQGSSTLEKLHKTEKEKRERTEKGITSKLEGRTNGRKKAYLVKGDQKAQGCLSLEVKPAKNYRGGERKRIKLHYCHCTDLQ